VPVDHPDGARADGAKVLFLSHAAGRTGAPRVIYHVARWAQENIHPVTMGFHFPVHGPLVAEFAPLGTVSAPRPVPSRMPARESVRRALAAGAAVTMRRRLPQVDLVWNNTLANGDSLAAIRRLYPRTPVITHAHELDDGIRIYTDAAALERTLRYSDAYLAASGATADFLTRKLDIRPERVRVAHEFIPVDEVRRSAAEVDPGRQELVGTRPLIVGCGTIEPRKGTDLFIDVADHLTRRHGDLDARLVWIGGGRQRDIAAAHEGVRASGLDDRVSFIGELPNPLGLLAEADVFLLTSREDCFPLVMLEAAALGVPTIAFAESGGAPEFIEDRYGITVPFLDTEAMAHAAADLVRDRARRDALGAAATARVRAIADVAVGAPHAWEAAFELVREFGGQRDARARSAS
jgi:glycosyltransferase involved in cell wall biosynthesis